MTATIPAAPAAPSPYVSVKVIRLMAQGYTDEAIGRRLDMSVRTVRRHIANYLARVGAQSRFQAGFQAGLSAARRGDVR